MLFRCCSRCLLLTLSSFFLLSRIVGKGIHSQNHIAKLKPAVVEFCEKNNLPHHTQDGNAGVIIVDLSQASGYQGQPNMEYTPQQGHQNHNNQQQHQSQQQDSNDDCVNLFVNVLTFCFKKFFK